MSQNGKGELPVIPGVNAPAPTLPMPAGPYLLIQLNQNGGVQVQGVIGDRIMCLGLLELAKEALAKHHEQLQKQILIARPNLKI